MEFFATTVVRVCRKLTGQHVFPMRMRLTHSRRTVSPELTEFFGSDIEFGATADEITFAAPVGLLPVVSADPYLNKLLTTYCEEALSRRPANLDSFRSARRERGGPAVAARQSTGRRNRASGSA